MQLLSTPPLWSRYAAISTICNLSAISYISPNAGIVRPPAATVIEYKRRFTPTTNLLCAQELSLQHVSNILWTYASFLHLKLAMTSAFVSEIERRLTREPFNPQQLSNLLWSLCIAEVMSLSPD